MLEIESRNEPTDIRGASILVIDDVLTNRDVLCQSLDSRGYSVAAAPSGEIGLRLAEQDLPELILLDVMMPGMDGLETCRQLKNREVTSHIPVIFITAKDETQNLVDGFRAGGVDYIAKPFNEEEIHARIETHLKNHRLTRALELEVARRRVAESTLEHVGQRLSILTEQEARKWGVSGFIGKSVVFSAILDRIRKVQEYVHTNVLILGESGVGKELIARAIHYGSPNAKGPFVPVNCSAIPNELGESMFFGHAKGAFSGATSEQKGFFEQANGGTLFLDEVGDMPLSLQVKLLRTLEDGVVIPLGSSTRQRKVDVRVLAGTNAELQSAIGAKEFRKDFYFRLARFTIDVPALRERREDIPLLARHFMNRLSHEMGMPDSGISSEALVKLEGYGFPGNVRELRNLIERALIESGGKIESHHLMFFENDEDRSSDEREPDEKNSVPKRVSRFPSGSDEEKVLRYVEAHERITNPECRQLLNVGLHRACYVLRKLAARGELQRENIGKATEYRKPI